MTEFLHTELLQQPDPNVFKGLKMNEIAHRFDRPFPRTLLLGVLAAILALASANVVAELAQEHRALTDAFAKQDAVAIQSAVAQINVRLGMKQGVPETPDRYAQIPVNVALLTKAEAISSLSKMGAQIARHRWWRVGINPTQLSQPLRDPASAIVGLLAASRLIHATSVATKDLDKSETRNIVPTPDAYLDAAREAGDFLLWAQTQAGTGVFPFPASRGHVSTAAFRSAEWYLARAEREGRENIVKNGWAVEDEDNGGLQFDNGECGVAMFALYEATQNKKYLDAALRSSEWAARRPLVANWNYNAFSVRLLSRAYAVTGNAMFLESATRKALLGVIPGQLVAGDNTGRWADPHNARPTYHYIMMDSLVELLAAMRKAKMDKDGASDKVVRALRLGLIARNRDFLPAGKGATTKETAMLALLNVNRVFANETEFLQVTQSDAALDGLKKLVSSQFRRGAQPLAPGAWGLFVESLDR